MFIWFDLFFFFNDLEMEKHCKRRQQRRLLKLQPLQLLVEAKELLRNDPFRFSFGLICRLITFFFISLKMWVNLDLSFALVWIRTILSFVLKIATVVPYLIFIWLVIKYNYKFNIYLFGTLYFLLDLSLSFIWIAIWCHWIVSAVLWWNLIWSFFDLLRSIFLQLYCLFRGHSSTCLGFTHPVRIAVWCLWCTFCLLEKSMCVCSIALP